MSPARAPDKRERADVLIVERGLAPTRQKAQALILAGEVWSGDARVDKPGATLRSTAELRVEPRRRFVSRGGEKLDGALSDLPTALHLRALDGVVALDIGASTGGFTDCLLQRGAAQVFAVDVGANQLDERLRSDPRVVVRDRTNGRDLTADQFEAPIDLVVVDASFIGLGLLMPAIARVLVKGDLVALVKPQFEAGKAEVSKGKGVIRDDAVRERAIDGAREAVREAGFEILSEVDSRLRGPKGNLERFLHATPRARR